MSNEKKFNPVRGTEAKILAHAQEDGNIYFSTDTGKIFLDTDAQNKMVLGNSGVTLFFGKVAEPEQDSLTDAYFFPYNEESVTNYKNCRVGDLILDEENGNFYKITEISASQFTCDLLSISGSGSGSGSSSGSKYVRGRLTVTLTSETDILNGADCYANITAASATEDGVAIDDGSTNPMRVKIEYSEKDSTLVYYSETIKVENGQTVSYNIGKNLHSSVTTVVSFTISGSSSNTFYSDGKTEREITCNPLTIAWVDTSFTSNNYFNESNNPLYIRASLSTSSNRIADIYFDGQLVKMAAYDSGKGNTIDVTLNSKSKILDSTGAETSATLGSAGLWTHGTHIIKADISLAKSDGSKGATTDPITKEIAIMTDSTKPLIWLGEFNDTCYEYDSVLVPYRVYDPTTNDTFVKVYLYKDNKDVLDGSYIEVSKTTTDWTYWEITDLTQGQESIYTIRISTGENATQRNITLNVLEDDRHMGTQESGLLLSFASRGRSNNEAKQKRETVTVADLSDSAKTKKATFSNFNWYNNGWIFDDNNNTCLRISNGASFKIPLGSMVFGGTAAKTIEFRMKIRNVQDYSTLVTNYTRYHQVDSTENEVWNDEDSGVFQKFLDQRSGGITSYDAYLTKMIPIWQAEEEAASGGTHTTPDYDDLSYNKLYRDYNLSNAIITYKQDSGDISSIPAICFGPQDGFFSNGSDSVTTNFVEDEIISVTITLGTGSLTSTNYGNNALMKVYLNGMLTSIARNKKTSQWYIGNTVKDTTTNTVPETYLTFNSSVCDIDLYNFRIYNRELGTAEVLQNYAYDNRDVLEWDLSSSIGRYSDIEEDYFSYKYMTDTYNASDEVLNGTREPMMPYILFTTDDTSSGNAKAIGNLPWFKTESADTGVSHYETVDMEFINAPLDIAYKRGLLAQVAADAGYVDTYDKKGNLDKTAVQNYYLHHCPSFTASDIQLGVQGTSSEFYPRRNYKAKTKVDEKVYDDNGSVVTEDTTVTIGTETVTSTTEKTESVYKMIPHKGPFQSEYEAYLADTTGEVSADTQKFFYYDNDITGTNKFTLKVDYMESSGSYNMGLANLVNSAYSHHPLYDYSKKSAIGILSAGKETEIIAGTVTYDALNGNYWYKNHKGNWKEALTGNTTHDDAISSDYKGDITITSQAELDAGPIASGVSKVLGAKGNGDVNTTGTYEYAANALGLTVEEVINKYYNKYFDYVEGTCDATTISETTLKGYRTSVQGFPTLAFHQTKTMKENNEEPVYIGRYNMLLDKGANEAYGFKLDSKYVSCYDEDHKTMASMAECWEFENNSRGFCSFRDPWNRKELSFAAPEDMNLTDSEKYTSAGAPIVADSFEYRYNVDSDYIDLLTHINHYSTDKDARVTLYKQYKIDIQNDKESGRTKLLELYSNWEKACKWVWSTATDAQVRIDSAGTLASVPSLGTYELNSNIASKYTAGVYYTSKYSESTGDNVYTLSNDAYSSSETYYKKATDSDGNVTYSSVKLTDNDDYVYETGKYYTLINDNYVLNEDAFDEYTDYYELVENYSSITLTSSTYEKGKYFEIIDGQYRRVNDDAFDSTKKYYKSGIDDFWKLEEEKQYGTIYYNYDTQEYRLAKFKNELEDHFNLEYLATYFAITEALECYDSRGKNCMMASWGPQSEGGDYIWYPIFYDLDTQLGINNTGIPSFEYNIDATEEGSFSTNDSVLWNNFYALFKSTVSAKYQQLKGTAISSFTGYNTDTTGTLKSPPFMNVDRIEQWYSCDPDLYNDYATQGIRPLAALNMDEQYKYISTTSNKGDYVTSGSNKLADPPIRAGYIGSSLNNPLLKQDDSDTYFYALQGNRSMSRRQFLTNRLNYLDSWLNVGDYARAGENRIRSRISANNTKKTSDIWIEGTAHNGDTSLKTNEPYYLTQVTSSDGYSSDKEYYIWSKTDKAYSKLSGTPTTDAWNNYVTSQTIYYRDDNGSHKAHMFDGEYWITMTPVRKMYVTVGTDAANFESVKYNTTAVKFSTPDLQNGVRKSGNYREQLYYIYGLDQMRSLGDMSKLYFVEFYLEGKISKMTDLLLGYDGLDEADREYKNSDVNDWAIPAAAGSLNGGMPLLKEVNLSNITFKNSNFSLDFSSCEKLENFRCTGSNITGVTFASGVSLNTLYLSNTITSLELKEARLLTKLITTYNHPVYNSTTEKLEADPGLYIADLTDRKSSTSATKMTKIVLNGGNLGYNSYILLSKYYDSCILAPGTTRQIEMTDVQWSPYVVIDDQEMAYDSSNTYYVDNDHFGFREFDPAEDDWEDLLQNNKLYTKDESLVLENITTPELFLNILSKGYLQDTSGNTPNLTGIVYIDNEWDTNILNNYDEGYIQSQLQDKFPNLQFFFKNVTKGKSAQFIIIKDDGTKKVMLTQKLSAEAVAADPTIFFTDPTTYSSLDGSLLADEKGISWIFKGWATDKDGTNMVIQYQDTKAFDIGDNTSTTYSVKTNNWNSLSLTEESDYVFYAIFVHKQYVVRFYNYHEDYTASDAKDDAYVVNITLDEKVNAPDAAAFLPQKEYTGTETEKICQFIHWSTSSTKDVEAAWGTDGIKVTTAMEFYPIFSELSIRDSIVIAAQKDYFTYTSVTVKPSTYRISGSSITGWRIAPKAGITLPKKIIIPTSYTDSEGTTQNVISVGKISSVTYGTDGAEYIFFEEGNSIIEISDYAFCGSASGTSITSTKYSNLIYLDWANLTALRFIGMYSFARAQNFTENRFVLPATVQAISYQAFLQGLSQSAFELVIPSATIAIGDAALNFNHLTKAATIIIGASGDPSQLDVSLLVSTTNSKIGTGSSIASVTIYTTKYSKDDLSGAFPTDNLSVSAS